MVIGGENQNQLVSRNIVKQQVQQRKSNLQNKAKAGKQGDKTKARKVKKKKTYREKDTKITINCQSKKGAP